MSDNGKDARIHIIGAGISGLIAATNLEKQGYSPVILEASDRIGGRVATDIIEGYQLDRGFQVLLNAYPMANKYLDYEALELQKLRPGAMIYTDGSGSMFGDPLRDPGMLFDTVFSKAATLKDKWKILQLKRTLDRMPLADIFQMEECTTLEYLQSFGFSETVIAHFFRPFFSGIFLEDQLATSNRMFAFVYKLFGEGDAQIPKAGIGAIPEQLAQQLERTTIQLESPVASVQQQQIFMESGEQIATDFTILATDPSGLLPNFASSLEWKSCDNLYFTAPQKSIQTPLIGLNSKRDGLINNLFFPTSIATKHRGDQELLSVTVVGEHTHTKEELIAHVNAELASDFGIADAKYLHHYRIDQALPQLDDLQYERDKTEALVTEKIAIAGDHHLNGSLNAAMVSGETAALMAGLVLTESNTIFA